MEPVCFQSIQRLSECSDKGLLEPRKDEMDTSTTSSLPVPRSAHRSGTQQVSTKTASHTHVTLRPAPRAFAGGVPSTGTPSRTPLPLASLANYHSSLAQGTNCHTRLSSSSPGGGAPNAHEPPADVLVRRSLQSIINRSPLTAILCRLWALASKHSTLLLIVFLIQISDQGIFHIKIETSYLLHCHWHKSQS